ncbi:MAG: hypothetical protein K9M80_04505 [Candidatus Marinimicrobia bacterium]|nr:hypothetical protein [Candidatus Neomarinimicrobiota bacterium]
MRKYFSVSIILLSLFCFTFANDLSLSSPLTKRQKFSAYLQYGNNQQESQDSVSFSFQKSPALAFMMSAVVPGAGQFYAGKKWWSLGFLGVEALGWGLWYDRKTYGEDLEDEYKQFADNNWNFERWIDEWVSNSDLYVASHGIHVVLVDEKDNIIEGSSFEVGEDYYQKKEEMFNQYSQQNPDDILAVKSRDYYENIGKYHQFAAGWEDYNDISQSDTVVVAGMRKDYVHQRDKSNQALKFATKSLTVVMFNHLFSALHAQIAAKHYSDKAEEPKQMSWNLSLTPGRLKGQLISGLNLSLAF